MSERFDFRTKKLALIRLMFYCAKDMLECGGTS
jgi:hypothetical protein